MSIDEKHKRVIDLEKQLIKNPNDWTAKHLIQAYKDDIKEHLSKQQNNKFKSIDHLIYK